MQNVSKENVKVTKNYMLIIIIIITIIIIIIIIIITTTTTIIIIFFFKVDFYVTSYNYKKIINVNLPRKLEKNSDTKRFANSLM